MFDLDGTITNTGLMPPKAWSAAFASIGIELPSDVKRQIIGNVMPKKLKLIYETFKEDFDLGIINLDEMLALRFEKERGMLEALKKEGKLLKLGALEKLTEFYESGAIMGIATSSPRERAEMLLETAGIRQLFTEIVALEDVKNYKPDPEPCNLLIERLGVSANDAIMIGDHPNDVWAGARSSCGKGIWLKDSVYPTREEPFADVLRVCVGNRVFENWYEMAEYIEYAYAPVLA